jgi:type I restriction enzyme R subunit
MQASSLSVEANAPQQLVQPDSHPPAIANLAPMIGKFGLMIFSEDSRVKIPCILHLARLGYRYISLKNAVWDEETNIFPDLFHAAIAGINPGIERDDVDRLLADVKLSLKNEDLGKAFYEKLTERSGIRLIDFAVFDNNSFHVVTELTCKNGDDEFRPDITLLINGMPLTFIEVKKPNNREGVLAERNRIITRCRNPRFRSFINITQLMVFSNNMEYDDGSPQPIEGAFYASASYDAPTFNYFREEEELNLADLLADEDDAVENAVLCDNNLNVIKHSPEFISNKSPDTPTNRICTSLFSRDRLSFLLQYALVYVKETVGLHKHVMRYPQIFATKAIERKLDAGVRKGIIWHTQGSGKTALAYYNTRFLTDYFQRHGIIPKFYFIVDRIDLLIQAQREFSCRGLTVHTIDTREAFARDIKATQALQNHSGRPEITVVNIQKFQDDPDVVRTEDYDVSIQRIYFLDEVHRSYNPQGSFLANLSQSDRNAIKIGLTGTPLLGIDYNSRALFGDYIHKYYYNASIADGYTLRLIREEIATNYRLSLQEALAAVELQQGDIDRKLLYAHPRFVDPMLDYIIRDFEKSRSALNDATIGGMVICDSAEQAKQMFKIFNTVYADQAQPPYALEDSAQDLIAARQPHSYASRVILENKVKGRRANPARCRQQGGTKKLGRGRYKNSWRGYKLHLDTADCGVPIAALLSSASMHDSLAAIPLSLISADRVTNLYDLMDAAYCSADLREHSQSLGHVPLIDHNPRRGEKIEFSPAEAIRYNERTAAERSNARLKDEFGGQTIRVKGDTKVMAHLMFGILALSADQLMRLRR